MNSYPANINPAAVQLLKEFSKDLYKLSVLELGCNVGSLGKYFINEMKNKLIYWHGVDYNKNSVEIARSQIDKASCFDLNQISSVELKKIKRDICPDIILMVDTLEHLTMPERLISLLLTVFPRAPLLVILPNISCLTIIDQLSRGEFNYTKHGILDFTHLKHFTPSSSLKFFKKYGYKISRQPLFLHEPCLSHLTGIQTFPSTIEYNDLKLKIKSETNLNTLISYGFGLIAYPR